MVLPRYSLVYQRRNPQVMTKGRGVSAPDPSSKLESTMKKLMYVAMVASAFPVAAMAGGMAQPIVEPMVQIAPPVMMAPAVDWTGAYAGAVLGFGKAAASGGDPDGNAGMAGLNAGYLKDFGQFVLGGEVSYVKSNVGVKSGHDQVNQTLGAQVIVGADLGRTLVYVSGGAARAEATLGGVSGFDNGYSASIGADYMVNDKFTLGAELKSNRYNDFKNSGVDLTDTSLGMKVGMRF